LPVPHPKDGVLYIKLRDYPAVANATILVAQDLPASADEAARTDVRQAAPNASQDPP
jgi:hypothetical protein